jgi:hypothetical protein
VQSRDAIFQKGALLKQKLKAQKANGAQREIDDEEFRPDVADLLYVDTFSMLWMAGRLPVNRPEHLKESLRHLEQMVGQSRESWKHILAETDDDHEWIPNPKQTGFGGTKVDEKMVAAWKLVLDESEAVLSGKKLAPHWRFPDGFGVNVRRVFIEPGRTFEPILWVQGSAASPYIERGDCTQKRFWERVSDSFGGPLFFVGYAIWFN